MSIGMNGILITGMTYPVQFGVWADVHGTKHNTNISWNVNLDGLQKPLLILRVIMQCVMAEPIIMVLVTSTITMTTSVLEVTIDIAGLVEVAVMVQIIVSVVMMDFTQMDRTVGFVLLLAIVITDNARQVLIRNVCIVKEK